MTDKNALKKRIRIASKQEKADFVLKNCRVVNVFTHTIDECDIAFAGEYIAGLGSYDGIEEYDAKGLFALPGLIDSHIHIESSFVTPEEIGRLSTPHGTTVMIADPHEIVNVCGVKGLEYMMEASQHTALCVYYMLPSCVPCTEWEDSGARLSSRDMLPYLRDHRVGGVGEMMNSYGVLSCDDEVIEKILAARIENAVIDGHAPALLAEKLMGYMAAGICTDHECGSVEEMKQRLSGGMYVQLRYGSACKELPKLLSGLDEYNTARCLLCSDDRQTADFIRRGDVDDMLRVCVQNGIDPITAVQMATINAARCYRLHDRGAIAPSRKADVVLVDDLKSFNARRVYIGGKLIAENGVYLPHTDRADISPVANSMHVKDFSIEKLSLHLTSDTVNVIDVLPETVLTGHGTAKIKLTEDGDFFFDEKADVARISVIERHHNTGKAANGFIRGYGINKGAVALSVGHDSHNILTVGVSKEEMAFAVEELIKQQGGIVLCRNRTVLASLPLPVAGLMSDKSGEEVAQKLSEIEKICIEQLGVNPKLDSMMTLCFMSLPVIPALKITDQGLFDVTNQRFVPIEAEEEK
ncbi:MAG: adenine deaminase [Ruminococcus sp.]|nr:adenine deaminase [Ruminococcus sp.]